MSSPRRSAPFSSSRSKAYRNEPQAFLWWRSNWKAATPFGRVRGRANIGWKIVQLGRIASPTFCRATYPTPMHSPTMPAPGFCRGRISVVKSFGLTVGRITVIPSSGGLRANTPHLGCDNLTWSGFPIPTRSDRPFSAGDTGHWEAP